MGVPAARVTDPVGGHGGEKLADTLGWNTLAGVLVGGAIGAVMVGVTIATGGGALLVASMALGAVGTTAMTAATGLKVDRVTADQTAQKRGQGCSKLDEGSPNVFVEGQRAARRDDHNDHGSSPKLVEGAATVFVNGRPFGRVGDRSSCGGRVIRGARQTFVGGPSSDSAASSPAVSDGMLSSVTRLFDAGLYSAVAGGDTDAVIELLQGVSLIAGAFSTITGVPAMGARLAMAATASKSIGWGARLAWGIPSSGGAFVLGKTVAPVAAERGAELGAEHWGEQGRIWAGAAAGAVAGAIAGGVVYGSSGRVAAMRGARVPRRSDVVPRMQDAEHTLVIERPIAVGAPPLIARAAPSTSAAPPRVLRLVPADRAPRAECRTCSTPARFEALDAKMHSSMPMTPSELARWRELRFALALDTKRALTPAELKEWRVMKVAAIESQRAARAATYARLRKEGKLGDLRDRELEAIQERTDKLGADVYVVGSAAKGKRRNVDTDLPLAADFRSDKRLTRSDIDYAVAVEHGDRAQKLDFPDADGKLGVLEVEAINLKNSPAIRFRPNAPPEYFPQGERGIPLNEAGARWLDRKGIEPVGAGGRPLQESLPSARAVATDAAQSLSDRRP